ncbi:MAG: RNA-binding protein [Deltaproteobacteria bacterium]|nr:RNA-binding protein [Deltaproteobacteria bacterium]
MSNNRLYVGNLPFKVTDADLTNLFSPFGTVSQANVVTDRDTGRSRGFAFVEMGTPEQAQAAIGGLDGKPFEGRNLQVSIARPREDRPRGGGGGGGRY